MNEPVIDYKELVDRYIELQADLKEEQEKNKRLRKALHYANDKIKDWLVLDTIRRISDGYGECPRCKGGGFEPGHRMPMDCTNCQGTGLSEPLKNKHHSPLNTGAAGKDASAPI